MRDIVNALNGLEVRVESNGRLRLVTADGLPANVGQSLCSQQRGMLVRAMYNDQLRSRVYQIASPLMCAQLAELRIYLLSLAG
jgi:hypothetical protein